MNAEHIATLEQLENWAEANSPGHAYYLSPSEADALAAALALVERLPKTKDGVVVVPWDSVWSVEEEQGVFERRPQRRDNPNSPSARKNGWWTTPARFTNYEYRDLRVSQCYSTREAAEKAGEACN